VNLPKQKAVLVMLEHHGHPVRVPLKAVLGRGGLVPSARSHATDPAIETSWRCQSHE
jgi:hypothetical protein